LINLANFYGRGLVARFLSLNRNARPKKMVIFVLDNRTCCTLDDKIGQFYWLTKSVDFCKIQSWFYWQTKSAYFLDCMSCQILMSLCLWKLLTVVIQGKVVVTVATVVCLCLGICRVVENPQSSGKWNVFLSKPQVFCISWFDCIIYIFQFYFILLRFYAW